MKLLHLVRHAKSSWDDPALSDLERPLNRRGHDAAAMMAAHLRRAGIAPDAVLCSPAARARQTLDLLLGRIAAPPPRFDQRIYQADLPALISCLGDLPESVTTALVVGHSPGLEQLALALLDESGNDLLTRRLREKYPTGALVTLEAAVNSWRDLATFHHCRLAAFVRPADLERTPA